MVGVCSLLWLCILSYAACVELLLLGGGGCFFRGFVVGFLLRFCLVVLLDIEVV